MNSVDRFAAYTIGAVAAGVKGAETQ